LRLESAAIRGHTCKVVVTEPGEDGRPLDLSTLRRSVEARLDRSPRARQKVVSTPLGLGEPVWVDDVDFDIRHHVRRVDTEGEMGVVELRQIAATLMSERLDHSRPLWRLDLVAPLTGGSTALVLRIHHCMADGVSAMRFAEQILWDPEPQPAPSEPVPWHPEPGPSALSLARSGIAERIAGAARATPVLARAVVSPVRWREAARTVSALPGALRRELTPLAARSSPFDRHIGPRRMVAWARSEIAELKRIEHAAGEGVTVNDVLLGAVAGGLRDWLRAHEHELPPMRAQIPVSMHRREEHSQLGNRDSFLFVDLPVDDSDPADRLRRINAETTERKARHDADVLYAFFHSLSHLTPLYRRGVQIASGPREFSLSISNVPGPREERFVLGHRVSAVYSFAEPADRHALRVSAISLAGTMQIGICADPDAVSGLDGLATAIERSVAELGARYP